MHAILPVASVDFLSDVYDPSASPHVELVRTLQAFEKRFEYQGALHAPAHHLELCMLDNRKGSIESIMNNSVSSKEDDLTLAACIASPSDFESESPNANIANLRRYQYVLNDQNRAGEIISRLRRTKRHLKLNTL